ncbi:hypothetical protein DOTSEDRAFT_169698 [Lecanosticta acicola]|uniref:Zn(2)-C6 fungal-type domain-containing protein n=1 Tax=Lecanosticta acicola TaxID=111012 RepID=A0AAI9EDU0_9PEZI|nr:hypothetical protein DOTSEDRAFT_169698 [Lecanosticta acicola]
MSRHQPLQTTDVLDPRLGGNSPSNNPAPPPSSQLKYERAPTHFSSASNVNAYPPHQSPQPYYHPYSTPQAHDTPGQSVNGPSTANASNQASPEGTDGAYQIPADAGENSPGEEGNGQPGDDSKRPRACEACRGLKVRCDQDPQHPELPCRRCQKAGRQCIITAPSRKRQKKADTRVAELEKKLDALTAVLQQQRSGQAPYGSPQHIGIAPQADMMHGRASTSSIPQFAQPSPSTGQSGSADRTPMQPSQKRRRTGAGPGDADALDAQQAEREDSTIEHFREITDAWAPSRDSMRYLIHRSPEEFLNRINSLVNPDMGKTIFNRYITKLAPHMPAVAFAPGTNAEQVWKDKPILYVCILSSASAGYLHPDVTKQLSREAFRAIADCVVCNGAKSLELVQAMQVLALWYKPPEKAEQTNFYQIIHMAAAMAIDIGLGKRFNPAKARRGFGGPHAEYAPGPQMILPQNSDTMEARRAWLASYYLCASASMVLRRPNLLRWTNYMKECIDVLETSSDALPSDKLFCQYIRVQHICENIGLQFLMDDNTATVSITDPKVTYALNVLENDLKTWADGIPPECKDHPALKFFEHVANLYLHEIALHFNHNIEDFRLPFTEESLKSVNNSSETLTQHQMAALEACRKSAHGILDTFLSMEVETVKALPMLIYFVRCTYALVILIKMHVAITTPGSEISKIMSVRDVRVDFYVDGLISMFGHVANEQEFRPHPKILRILSVLRNWFGKHKENVAAQARGEQLPHPAATAFQASRQASNTDSAASNTQTPLHLLSQVATGNQGQQSGGDSQDWSFSTPFPVDYTQPPPAGHPDAKFPAHQQQQAPAQASTYPPLPDATTAYADQSGMDGQMSHEYLWGSGFEQAMDLSLGSMDGLSSGGIDGLFFGAGMAPFGLNGDGLGAAGW